MNQLPQPHKEEYSCINCGKPTYKETCTRSCGDDLRKVRKAIKEQIELESLHPKRESARRVKKYYTY